MDQLVYHAVFIIKWSNQWYLFPGFEKTALLKQDEEMANYQMELRGGCEIENAEKMFRGSGKRLGGDGKGKAGRKSGGKYGSLDTKAKTVYA